MKPVFLTLILMLGLPSAFAAERYTEVWNPPEAQTAKGKKPRAATQMAQAAAKKKRKSGTCGTSVKQVADKATADPQPTITARGKNVSPRQTEPVIPRIIGPNGLALQV